jgi:hypothetical protein
MTHRLAIRFIAVALALVLFAGTGIVGQSNPQVRKEDRPVIGVYFDEPLKLLEPFDKDFRRSCTCVEHAFARIPRIVHDPGSIGSAVVPLRPGEAFLRVLRDMADVRWRDAVIFQEAPTPRMLITGRGVPPLDREAAIVPGVQGYLELAQRGQSKPQRRRTAEKSNPNPIRAVSTVCWSDVLTEASFPTGSE